MELFMKKTAVLLLTGAMCAALFTGCGKQNEIPAQQPEQPAQEISVVEVEDLTGQDDPAEASAEEEQPDLHAGEARSDLTGEWISEDVAAQRPFAVMMGNTKIATPQYGIGEADVIYEAPVEGSETRLMPIFQDYGDIEKIMSIRSCRLYYIDWALEFEAIYGHYGQAYLAKEMLGNSYVNNLSGLDGSLENTMYFRDSSRKAPHNAYTTGDGIREGISIKGYESQHAADYEPHYTFNQDDSAEINLENGEDAAVVRPGYKVNRPWFVYDPQTGLYARYQNGERQFDAMTEETVRVKNILIQICDWYVTDNETGYLAVDTMSGGKGYYITNGKAIPVTWSKASQKAPTKYYDAGGQEIVMNQGKTWVCITQNTLEDQIAFYASEEEFQTAE